MEGGKQHLIMPQALSQLPIRILRRIYQGAGLSRERIYRNVPMDPVVPPVEGNDLIAASIRKGKPCMISRFGTPESLAILNYLDIQETQSPSGLMRCHAFLQGRWDKWAEKIKGLLFNNVGFFPTTDENLDRFAQYYMTQIGPVDMIGVWTIVPGESYLIKRYCPEALRFDPSALEPYFYANPWSMALEGRKVLVIHPFAASIEAQYRRRKLLFRDPRVLPDFHLTTVRAVQSLAGSGTPFKDWFEALAWMQDEVKKVDFDVAIIGAGAYGLPLSAFVKSLGKVSIHMGGATQVLFGIRGKRWDNMKEFSNIINEHWVRPAPSEMIPSANKIEDGCYW